MDQEENIRTKLATYLKHAAETFDLSPMSEPVFDSLCKNYVLDRRIYHTLGHCLEVSTHNPSAFETIADKKMARRLAALCTFAGLFHDVIYIGTDKLIPESLMTGFNRYGTFKVGYKYFVLHDALEEIPGHIAMIFGYSPTSSIELERGGNEFLSAIIAETILSDMHMPLSHILQIVSIIEATIPFRERNHFLMSHDRLVKVNKLLPSWANQLTEEEITLTIQAACHLANVDVLSFAGGRITTKTTLSGRFQRFIKDMWRLIPEADPSLLECRYTPRYYRETLLSNRNMLARLEPDIIFHSYKNFPTIRDMDKYFAYSATNLKLGLLYLNLKLIGAMIIEALDHCAAKQSGIENAYLPQLIDGIDLPKDTDMPDMIKTEEQKIVFTILRDGIAEKENPFDSQPSPVSAYLYEHVGRSASLELMTSAGGIMNEHYKPIAFLEITARIIGKDHLRTIALALANAARDNNIAEMHCNEIEKVPTRLVIRA